MQEHDTLLGWAIQALLGLVAIIFGLLLRELWLVRRKVHMLINRTIALSIYLSMAARRIGLPWKGWKDD